MCLTAVHILCAISKTRVGMDIMSRRFPLKRKSLYRFPRNKCQRMPVNPGKNRRYKLSDLDNVVSNQLR